MIMYIMKTWADVSSGYVMALYNGISAYAMQIANEVGGIRVVEMLVVTGFAIGFLACLYKIKHIEG